MNHPPKNNRHYSFSYYRKILQSLKENYDANYVLSEIPQIFSQIHRPKFIIRHDIHESLIKSLDLAKIEKEYSIRGSFMINVLSPHFNLKQKDNLSIIKQILNLGHEIGLYIHYTSSFVSSQNKITPNENEIISQYRYLESLTKRQVSCVSFSKEFSNIPEDSFFICKKVSASSKTLMQEALSDSRDIKEHKKILAKINNPQKKVLQLLIHPEFWHKD